MSTPHSQRPRPAAFWAILDFYNWADEWQESAKLPSGGGRILESLRRALISLTHASAGRDTRKQLRRLRDALDECKTNFMVLHGQHPTIAEEGYRRVERIVEMVQALAPLDPREWPKVAPPPPVAAAPPRARTLLEVPTVRRRIPRRLLN